MSDIIEVIKDVTTVTIASDGPQGPTGPTGSTGATGPAGPTGPAGADGVVQSITGTSPITVGGTATVPVIGITQASITIAESQVTNLVTDLAAKAPLASPTFTGTVTIPAGSSITGVPYLATANTFTGGVQQITTASAATVGLIIKGVSGQTSSLQEWQDNTGAVVSRVSPNGNFNIGSTLAPKTVLQVTQSASAPSVPVLGTASGGLYIANLGGAYGLLFGLLGTGNAWIQNQRTDAVATAYSITFQPSGGNIGIGPVSGTPSAKLQVHSDAAATVVAIVRGAASQTANLFEAQNNAGSALSRIDSAGNVYGNGFVTSRYITDINSTTPFIDFSSNRLTINSRNAAYVGLVVKGVASQTANLQDWQNSSATVLTAVNASGTINFQTGNTSATANTGAVALPALAVGFITMQVAGTTVKVPYYAN